MKPGLKERFIRGGKNTLSENIIVCLAAALAGTFYFYEYYYESRFAVHTGLSLAITAAIFVIWLICAAFSGKDGKIGFIIFSFLYWSVPYLYLLYYYSRDNVANYSKWLSMFSKICTALLYNPFYEAAKKMGTDSVTLAAILLICVMGVYVAAFFIKRSYDSARAERLETDDEEDYDGEYIRDDEDDYEDEEGEY